jgi:hypothetical protein
MTPEVVFRLCAAVGGFGVAISALEYLAVPAYFAAGSISDWRVLIAKYPTSRMTPVVGRLFDERGIRALLVARLAAALALLVPVLPIAVAACAAAIVFVTGVLLTYRCGFGEDGSDQMSTVIAAGLVAYAVIPDGSPWKPMGLWFIGAQSVLSYAAAGYAKLVSPVWRSGEASLLIFRTATYSNERIARTLQRSTLARQALAWTTIGFECLFPLTLVAPRPITLAFLALGFTFHLLNAAVMGLNVFFWEFVATYPAVILLRDRIGV